MAGHKDSRESFERSLEGLTSNCKPQIDDLTRAAGQFEAEESQIVGVIETRIMKVAEANEVIVMDYHFYMHVCCMSIIYVINCFIMND